MVTCLETMVMQLRKLSFKMINLPTSLLPAWESALKDASLDVRCMPRDVRTQWNSTYDMLHFALEYREGIDAITDKVRLGVDKLGLSEADWKLVEQLQDILQVLKEAMLYFSRSKPNLVMVIPAMDYIDEIFTTGLLNERRLDPAICAAIGLTKKTLN
ncbi:hypothetical protein F5887DRAFT_1276209 [Amanita rubescens]|nr:hypothetical protein F5887DRAFT_1276209 [Amanita rubescens]